MLLGVLFSGDATGGCRARRIEKATDESLPLRFLAGDLHPDHDPIAHFRKTLLPERTDLWVPVVFLAPAAGVLQLGHLSLDGTTSHAAAATSPAVSATRLLERAPPWRAAVDALCARSAQADQGPLPDGVSLAEAIARRQERLAHVAQATAGLAARAQARSHAARAAYEAQRPAREDTARQQGRKPRGPTPQPPQPGPRDTEQSPGTDPESRLMHNSPHDGFDHQDHAHVATDPDRGLLGAYARSNHAHDPAEVVPTLATLPEALGTPPAGGLETGSFSAAHIAAWAQRGMAPSIAVGRQAPPPPWSVSGAPPPAPPPDDARPLGTRAATRRTAIGQALYRWRTGPVEPVCGLIKDGLGFRPGSLRGWEAAARAGCLVCLAFHRQRRPVLFAD